MSSNVADVNERNNKTDGRFVNDNEHKDANEPIKDAKSAHRDDRPNVVDNSDNGDDDNNDDYGGEKSDQDKVYYKLPPQNDPEGDHVQVDQKEKPKVILLVAYFRSGSSFVGELLNNHPDIFYFFEPLFSIDQKGKRYTLEKIVLKKLQLLEALFLCNVTADWGPQPMFVRSSAAVQRATGCWTPAVIRAADDKFEEPCYSEIMKLIGDLGRMAKMCMSYKYVAIKTIRLSVPAAAAFMDHPRFDAKVIHAIRHPLAVISSRSFLLKRGIKNTKRLQTEFLKKAPVCNTIYEDIKLGAELRSRHPNNYMMVRYEDIANDPKKLVKDIYNFLNISNYKQVLDWVSVHTRYDKSSHGRPMPRTSKQDSANASQLWKSRFANVDSSLMTSLETKCSLAIEAGGYSNLQRPPVLVNPVPLPHPT